MGTQDMTEKWTAFCVDEEAAQKVLDKAIAKSAGKFRIISAKKEFMDKKTTNSTHPIYDKVSLKELRPYKFTIVMAFLDK